MLHQQQTVVKAPLAAPTTGRSFPLGATMVHGGANFSLFSRSAARIELLFFDRVDDARPSRVIPLDPSVSRTYHYWHVFVPGVQAGQIYGFRAYSIIRTEAQGIRKRNVSDLPETRCYGTLRHAMLGEHRNLNA